MALSKTRSAFRSVAWESTPTLSGSFWVYRIQLSLPRVISCHTNNHSAHPVRQWPESRVAYPTKVPGAALENGKAPWRTFLDSKHLARAKMLDSGRGYHEPAALELIEGYHAQQKQPQATWSIRFNLIHTTEPRRDSPSTKLIVPAAN